MSNLNIGQGVHHFGCQSSNYYCYILQKFIQGDPKHDHNFIDIASYTCNDQSTATFSLNWMTEVHPQYLYHNILSIFCTCCNKRWTISVVKFSIDDKMLGKPENPVDMNMSDLSIIEYQVHIVIVSLLTITQNGHWKFSLFFQNFSW